MGVNGAVPTPLTLKAGRLGGASVIGVALAAATPLLPADLPPPLVVAAAGLLLLIFATAYAGLTRRLPSSGALYTFAARGLGRPFGVAAGWLALTAYQSMQLGLYAVLAPRFGAPWWAVAGACWAVVALSGMLPIGFAAWLMILLVVGALASLAIPVAADLPHTLDAFRLTDTGRPELGLLLLTATLTFAGIEVTAAFSQDVRRSTAPATYVVVLLLIILYALRSSTDVQATTWAFTASLLAGQLALHHVMVRYLAALGRERVLPPALARLRPASATQSVVAGLSIAALIFVPVDPQDIMLAGGLGIVVLLLGASLSALLFLNRHPSGEGFWRRLFTPAVSTVGFGVLGWLAYENHRALLACAAGPVVVGLLHAAVLRLAKPVVYAGIGLGGAAIVVAPSPSASTEPIAPSIPPSRVPGAHRPERINPEKMTG